MGIHRKDDREERAKRPAVAFDFLLCFPWWTHTETVRGRAGWARGGVRRMDAAAKPTRTYSRRPPRAHPARPKHGLCFKPPGGAQPLAANSGTITAVNPPTAVSVQC